MPAAAQSLHQKRAKSPATRTTAEPDPERLPPKDRDRWENRKLANERLADLFAQGPDDRFLKKAARALECSDTLKRVEYANRTTGDLTGRYETFKCHVRECPICQSGRAYKLGERFKEVLPKLKEQVPNGAFLLLTLTVRNCPVTELRQTLADMNRAWRRLVRYEDFRIVKGWIRGTEVTRGAWIDTRTGQPIPSRQVQKVPLKHRRIKDPELAHPHFHALLLVPSYYFAGKSYIKQAKWAELWKDAAQLNHTPIVDIRRVKTPEGGCGEVIKAATYSVKMSDLTEGEKAWFFEMHDQVQHLRFLATGGVIKAALGAIGDIGKKDEIEGATELTADSVKTGVADFYKRKRDDLRGERLPEQERFYKHTHTEMPDDPNPFNEEGTKNDHQG